MRWALSVALLVAGLAGCGPALDAPASGDPLDAAWLGGDDSIEASHLQKLVDLARGDPEVTAIYGEAVRSLGGSLQALASHMSICPAGVTQEGGLTIVESRDALASRSLEELAFGKASTADAQLTKVLKEPARQVRRVDEPDVVRFDVTAMPRICFVQRLSVGEAYEAVVHELVHALYYDPHDLVSLGASAPDEAAFLRAMALAKGGEVQAYVVGTRARARLKGGSFRSPLAAFVDVTSPTPVASERLAELVLAPRPQGLGYANGIFRGKYAEARGLAREWTMERRTFFANLVAERRQAEAAFARNVEIAEKNLVVHRHNADLYRARGDAANAAKSERSLAETQEHMARAKKLIETARASEARLTALVEDADRRLAAPQ